MVTTYEVLISEELLEEIRSDDSRLPEGFRVGEITAQPGPRVGEPPSWRSYYVRVEDDEAPADLEGQLVEPVFQSHLDADGNWVRTTIASRRAADRRAEGYVAYVSDGRQRSVQPSGRGEARSIPPYTEETGRD